MKKNGKRKNLPAEELSLFAEQIRLMLSAGMPLEEGAAALASGSADAGFCVFRRKMEETGELSASMEAAGLFPDYMTRMTRIGEETGELEKVMAGLAAFYSREAKLRDAVKKAVTYPLIIICMMAAVIVLLVVKVLPVFENVYRSLGLAESADVGALVKTGVAVGKWTLVIVGVLIVALLAAAVLVKTGHGKGIVQVALKRIPPLRNLMKKTRAVRFATVMQLMIGAGFPVDRAVDEAADVLGGSYGSGEIESLRINLDTIPFAEAVERSNLFTLLHARMLKVGEQTGRTDEALGRIAEMCEQEADESFGRFVSAIEPILVGVMAVVVGAILLSVMLPLANIIADIL